MSEPSAAKPTWASPPRQGESAPAGAAECVICDHTIEQCFEEGKTELGMAHDEVRKYPGWHHHRLTTMLAHVFLWHRKRHVGKKSPGPHRVAAANVIGSRLTRADVYGCRSAGINRMGAATQPPGVSSPSGAATRGRMRLWMEIFDTT